MRSGVFLTCVLILLSGCAHSNWQQAAVPSSARGTFGSASRDRVMMVEKLLDAATVPPRQAVPLLRAQSGDSPQVSLSSSSAGKSPLISHDAATLALIEKETREFIPGDRERAVAALKAIPSDSVPAVLKLWKAGLISPLASPTSPVVTAQATAADFDSPIQLAAYDPATANAGLGQSSPWADSHPQPDADSVRFNTPHSAGRPAGGVRQINRVEPPTFGYSSPFGNSENSPAQQGSRPTVAITVHRDPLHPAQWNPGMDTSNRRSLQNNDASGTLSPKSHDFGHGPVQTPPDWHGHSAPATSYQPPTTPQTPPDWPGRAAGHSPTSSRQPPPAPFSTSQKQAPEQSDLRSNLMADPIITPRITARPSERQADVSEPAPDAIHQARFSEQVGGDQAVEIPLSPGQALPGFEGSVPTPRRSEAEQPVFRSSPQSAVPQSLPPATQSGGEALQFLIQVTESEVSQLNPGETANDLQYYIERHVYLRLLYLMGGQTELALRPIPRVPPADQEFWTQVLWGVHSYFDMPRIPDHAERAAQTLAQFNTAMLRLKERAPLELKNVTFCNKIDGYGEYSTYPKEEFTPGQRVLIYAEIGNFHSELSAEGIYRTRLKSTLKVFTSDSPDQPVEVKTYPVTEDFCRNHRRDYFHSYVVEIPVRCTRGGHTLQLVIEDELSGKVATYQVPFTVR